MAKIHGFTQAAKDLDVSPISMRKWSDQAKHETSSNDEINWKKEAKKLQKENQYPKKINEVLKKSIATFPQDQIPPFK